MTALNVYGSNVAAATVATADKLATAAGGTETTFTCFTITVSQTGWMELLSQGGTWSPGGGIGSPSGGGWLLDSTVLEGQTIAAGTCSPFFGLQASAHSFGATVTMRAYKRSSGGVYTAIGTSGESGTTTIVTASRTSITLPTFSGLSTAFATGDKLYIDAWLHVTTGPAGGGAGVIVYISNSAATGVATDVEMDFPAYSPTASGVKGGTLSLMGVG